jgi:hypothetical protein
MIKVAVPYALKYVIKAMTSAIHGKVHFFAIVGLKFKQIWVD